MLMVMTMPKWIGSTPSFIATGKRMGASKSTIEEGSMKLPAMRSRIFTPSRNILLLIAGNFMEPSSIVLLLAPILFPVAMKLGVDPIHFGIVMTINMEVGLIHPPVGLNLYVASNIAKMGLTETTVAFAPWIVVMVLYLLLVTYVPQIATWLPNLIYARPG